MTLKVKTDLGIIKVNDGIIARILINSAEKTQGKLMLSAPKAKVLGIASRVGVGDLLGNFIIEEYEGKYFLTFYGIIRFGAGIKNVTQTVFDSIEEEMRTLFPDKGGVITLKIVGVKSKHMAERDIEVKREYEAARQSDKHKRYR